LPRVGENECRDASLCELTSLCWQARFGQTGSFVDDEGYPYDETELIIETKLKRQRNAVLQTDHRVLMKELELLLPQAFASQSSTDSTVAATPERAPGVAVAAFARVGAVTSNSPADHAGLLVGDLVVRFGRVNASRVAPADALLAVRDLVVASENSRISVVVERAAAAPVPDAAAPATTTTHVLALTPRRWSGPGLLGCLLNPL
jgi:26S proteasome non-ATPase regulatory subunit 9